MAKSIWKGFVSFGLVAIPVSVVPVENHHDIHFHLLDSRDKSRIRYQRINTESGKEVPWESIVRGYEVSKDQYVVLKDEDFQKVRPEAYKSIDISEFVELNEIDNIYFNKPYYLLPEGKNKKAYVLLREALKKTDSVGVGKIIIRTREYLGLIIPHNNALVLNLIRFEEEIRKEKEFDFPDETLKSYNISSPELKMAEQLVNQMKVKWDPNKYRDDYEAALQKWIEEKTKKSQITAPSKKAVPKKTEVIDFVTLLKQSMDKTDKKKSSNSRASSRRRRA